MDDTALDAYAPAQRKISLTYRQRFRLISFTFTEFQAIQELRQEVKLLKSRVNTNESRIEETSEKLENLEENVMSDRMKTIYQFADHCERLDHQSNKEKSHCVLITG